jgi:hypothetical protein
MKPSAKRVAVVMSFVASGRSYGQIAEELGMSRSAVAGIVHRNRKTQPDPSRAAPRAMAARKVSVRGSVYPSAPEAAFAWRVSQETIRKWCRRGVYGFRYVSSEALQ